MSKKLSRQNICNSRDFPYTLLWEKAVKLFLAYSLKMAFEQWNLFWGYATQQHLKFFTALLCCFCFFNFSTVYERSILFPTWQQCNQWSKIDECFDICLTILSLIILDHNWINASARFMNDWSPWIWTIDWLVFSGAWFNICWTGVEHLFKKLTLSVQFRLKSLFKKSGWEQEIQRRNERKEEKCMKSISREKSISKGKSRWNSNRCWTGVEHMMNKERKGKERK